MPRARGAGRLLAALFLACAAAAPAAAQDESGWSLHGYYKDFFTAWNAPEVTGVPGSAGQPAQALVLNSLRLAFRGPLAEGLSLAAAYELTPQAGDASGTAGWWPQSAANAYRIADLDARLYPAPGRPADNFTVAQNLDRLLLTYSPDFGDILLGRQPVAFGSAHVINPTDVLAPFSFQSLDKEERAGVDALQVRLPYGPMGEIGAGWVAGRDGRRQDSAAFLKPRFYWGETDVTFLLLAFREQVLAGLDLARSLGGASVWLEAAYTFAGALERRNPEEDYARASVGADYSFAGDWYAYLEYHYNGAGAAFPRDYPALGARTAYAQGADFLLGRHYLCPGLTWQASPLLSAALQVLYNLADNSAFFSPVLDYSFADNVTWEAGAFLAWGRPARSDPASGIPGLRTQSEFGLYPNLFFMAAKLYF